MHPAKQTLTALVLFAAALQAQVDYAKIRGCNYVPTYASTSVAIWKNFDAATIDRELAYAERLKLNSVRIFLQYVVYEDNPKLFLDRLETFLKLADKHGLTSMVVLFDSCFGDEPAMDKDQAPLWSNNPGFSRIGEDYWPKLKKYVHDVVGRHRNDRRVIAWDVMNEPMADLQHVTPEERAKIVKFCRQFCGFVKKIDSRHPITVGEAAAEDIQRTMDVVDVLSLHSYMPRPDWFKADLDLARVYGKQTGKPVIVTECGNPGVGQNYDMALDVLEKEKVGFYFWELMIGRMQFKTQAGVFYPDGVARDASAVARLLGFRLEPERVPLIARPDRSKVEALLADRSRWAAFVQECRGLRTQKEILPRMPALSIMGRFAARPRIEAQRIFELQLSIPQLFRMRREKEALSMYGQMLNLIADQVAAAR